jgi:hypothetical protein
MTDNKIRSSGTVVTQPITFPLCECGSPSSGSVGTCKEVSAAKACQDGLIPLPGLVASPGMVMVNDGPGRYVCKDCYRKIFPNTTV